MRLPFHSSALACALVALTAPVASAQDVPYCGDEGVWFQILGSGGADITDQRSAASYLVWVDEHARVLVDAGPGTALRFDEGGAAFEDLDAIVFTRLGVQTASDLPALIEGSIGGSRDRILPVFGPAAPDADSATAFIARMIGTAGLYPDLADFLTFRSRGGYKASVRDVPATGNRRWAQYGTANISLAAVPVHHADVPALAWRVRVGEFSLVFAGSFSNQKNVVAKFAKDADALIVHHALPEDARGSARERYAIPSQLGRVAAEANVCMLVLGHRTTRTTGLESVSRAAIEAHYDGPLVFANELECWGL